MQKQRIHTYAASFGHDLARDILIRFAVTGKNVIDPFAGSGTTLLEALSVGNHAIGIDVDPIACLISRVLTRKYSIDWLSDMASTSFREIEAIELEIKELDLNFVSLGHGESVTIGRHFIKIPNIPAVDYWFTKNQKITLAFLVSFMTTIMDEKQRDILSLSISSSIIRKWPYTISCAMDVDHSRPHKSLPADDSIAYYFSLFKRIFKSTIRILSKLVPISNSWPAEGLIIQGSSYEKLAVLDANSCDFILTSPPYVNAIDYPRAHKFSAWWLFDGNDEITRENYIGLRGTAKDQVLHGLAEKVIPNNFSRMDWLVNEKYRRKVAGQIFRYITDMNKIIQGCYCSLKKNGQLVFVLADNKIDGKVVPVVDIVSELLENNGFSNIIVERRDIDITRRRYPFGFSGTMKSEALIIASKNTI